MPEVSLKNGMLTLRTGERLHFKNDFKLKSIYSNETR